MNKKKWCGNSKIYSTIILVFVVCCLMATSSWAARKVDITSANARGFIGQLNKNGADLGSALGLSPDDGFQLLRSITDLNSETHYRYQQTYKGIPVWGMQTIVSKGRDNKVKKLNGNFVHGSRGDVGKIPTSLDSQGALRQMQELHKKKDASAIWNFRNEKAGTFVYFHKKSKKARLCYVVSFFADTECGNPSQPIFFIDAKNGKVLDSFDMLRYCEPVGVGPGGNLKVGYYYYGTDYPPFLVSVNGSTCTMDCPEVKTVDLNHGTSGTTAYSYTCYENTHGAINGGYCPLNDAQFFGQVIYDMYDDWYGVAPLTSQLTMRVHYSTNYENAFWDGSTMTFGDGYTTFYPLVALDVSAHEVSHGFTENNSDLIYSSQSGGINEAFSDMAGEAAEYYLRGTTDYRCGYDIFKNPTGALRYLYDPPLDGISIDHVDDYYSGMDVHYSSGIFNKAFYLIATTPGWTPRMAFDIFVKANQDYWTPSTNFQQGAEGVRYAALDYGYSSTDVVNAFTEVGICIPEEIFVSDITQTIIKIGNKYYSVEVITIMDTCNAPVANASVTNAWDGVVSGSSSGITGANGTVTLTSPQVGSIGPFINIAEIVTHPTLTYNSALNKENSDTAYYFTGTVGYTDIFGSTSTSANRRAMPFTMPENGNIGCVTIYHNGGSGSMILGVYDGEGAPGGRLHFTPTTAINSSAGWQTICLPSPAYVAGGTTVWLAWVFESNPGIRYQTGSPGRYQSSDTWSGGMPDPFGSGSQSDYIYSIYATYTVN
jgi:Zn-dependent metalloprotease